MTTGNTTEFPLRWVRRWTWRGRVWHAVDDEGVVQATVRPWQGAYSVSTHDDLYVRQIIRIDLSGAKRAVERAYAEQVMKAMAGDRDDGLQLNPVPKTQWVPFTILPGGTGTSTTTFPNTTSAPLTAEEVKDLMDGRTI